MDSSSSWRNELAARMAERTPALVEEIFNTLNQRLRAIQVLDLDAPSMRASVSDNMAVQLQLLDGATVPAAHQPPLRAQVLVRRLAQRGVSLNNIIEAYSFSNKHWVQACIKEIFSMNISTNLAQTAAFEIWDSSHNYVEHVCRLLTWEYEAERGKTLHGKDLQRAQAVATILEGTLDTASEAEFVLDYPLRSQQLAAVFWSVGGDLLTEAAKLSKQFDRAITLLAAAAPAVGAPLVVFRDDMTRWIWIPIQDAEIHDLRVLEHEIAKACPLVRIALGNPGTDRVGFVESHRQARIAHEIGLVSTRNQQVIAYQDVSSLMFLVNDLRRTAIWVREVLGDLTLQTPRAAELRNTLAAYIRLNRSVSAVAAELQCHRNTVHYRVAAAETVLGYRVMARPHDLAIALLACEWLGDSILDAEHR